MTVSSRTPSDNGRDDEVPDKSSWDAEAHFTSANYQSKKLVLLLFINRAQSVSLCTDRGSRFFPTSDRLVESTKIRKAVEGVYTGVLSKGSSPFVYLR